MTDTTGAPGDRLTRINDFANLNLERLPYHGQRWGNWELDKDCMVLSYVPKGYHLRIEFGTSSAMLDMIMQVARKPWATDADVGQLVRALRVIFDPQATLCSFGGNYRIDDPMAFLDDRIRDSNA